MGYSPWGLKESDTTEQLHYTSLILLKIAWSDSSMVKPKFDIEKSSYSRQF